MDIVKVSWSGGKDSTCAVMKHLERHDWVIAVCYIPMLTDTVPMLLKEHYEFILRTANLFRKMGAEVHIVNGMTYFEYVHHRAQKGKYKGKPFGFPCFKRGQCGFKRDSKLKALNTIDVGEFDYEDIGIAFDEKDRHKQLDCQHRSILNELGMTEKDAFSYCEKHGVLSPHYALLKRDGCTLCPHAGAREREMYFEQYPEAYNIVLDLQRFVKAEKPNQFPLRNYTWFIDDQGVIK